MRPSKSNNDAQSRCIDGFYGPLALVICIASCFTITLAPASNILINPECWYELMLLTTGYHFFTSCALAIETKDTLNPFNKRALKVIGDLFLFCKATDILTLCLIHLIWSGLLGYFEPFPKRMNISFYITIIVVIVRLWYLIPKQKRMDAPFRKRCMFYLARHLWSVCIYFQLNIGLNILLSIVRSDMQWLISLIVPLTKVFNDCFR